MRLYLNIKDYKYTTKDYYNNAKIIYFIQYNSK